MWNTKTIAAVSLALLSSLLVQAGDDVCDGCALETVDVKTGARTVVKSFARKIEAPNWTRDGRHLIYNSGGRLWRVPAAGGEETRLTEAPGLDDGPEYSPDGRHIWFCSVRSGLMQIWRMKSDGTEQTQITDEKERNCWFPHVSPDGRLVAYIAYRKGDLKPGEHLAGKHVELRVMPAEGGEARTVAKLYGGQGTINVNSWSPDSCKIAFVSYTEP